MAGHPDVGIATLSEWERGLARPTGDRALRYHQLLGRLASRSSTVRQRHAELSAQRPQDAPSKEKP